VPENTLRENRLLVRERERDELRLIWTIDRREMIDGIYHHEKGKLILKPEHYDVKGWLPDMPEICGAELLECYDRNGTFYGAFDGNRLVGVAVLESEFIGRNKDQLQLKFLHVGHDHRGKGLGRRLFNRTVDRARKRGAKLLYISSTPSVNTVHFYRNLGCRVTQDVDPGLFKLEPEDIHFEFKIPD
jgi:GNAT superfamily N-acetyltransferase